jgi:hypothetical protein
MIAVTGYSPKDLLRAARDLLPRSDLRSKGVWPRAAAHLCRQALEETLVLVNALPRSRAGAFRAVSHQLMNVVRPPKLPPGTLAP